MADQHPDLQRLYAALADGDEIIFEHDQEDDDEEDEDFEYFIGADELEDDDMIENEDDDEEYDDNDYEDDYYEEDDVGDEDEQLATLGDLGNSGIPGGTGAPGEIPASAWLELAQMINSPDHPNNEARSNLIARLLSDSTAANTGTTTRSGSILNRMFGGITGRGSREERARELARKRSQWWTPQKEPNPIGVELLQSGEFGVVGGWNCHKRGGRRAYYDPRIRGSRRSIPKARATLPNTNGTIVATYPSIPYVGQYAREDYSLFFSATQYFTLHLYDVAGTRITRKPRQPARPATRSATGAIPGSHTAGRRVRVDQEEEDDDEEDTAWGHWSSGRRGMARDDTSMKRIKTVQGEEGRWTVTDADSTKTGDRMIYSSITPYVHMLYTDEHEAEHICLDFSGARSRQRDMWGYDSFGIWSIRFSADGKEVVAGAGSGKIMVYDIDAQRRSLSIEGHADDVNAVCFADESSTNILVSGSDDGYVKVWDRRSLSGGTPSGVLVGATEGITYTSPKGDGRYIVVNSKDQAARLYDLRKMRQWSEFQDAQEKDAVARYGQPRYDYRNSVYPVPQRLAHPKDCSVMTFRGHAVLRTLIRCHFSPRESTGQSYVYSGSADGMIHIWSLDGRVVQVLDRSQSLPLRSPSGEYTDPSASEAPAARLPQPSTPNYDLYDGDSYVVRDVSWHGFEPTLMSTSWSLSAGARRGGSIAKHEWKGLGKGGMKNLEDWVERQQAEAAE